MVEFDSDWGSSRDPRRYIAVVNERNNSLRPVSSSLSSFASSMPEEVKKRVLVQRKIEKTHAQFAELVDPFILKHTNSVYLLKSQAVPGAYDLVVYLDNSTCAAELNARRELLRANRRNDVGYRGSSFKGFVPTRYDGSEASK